MNEFIQISFILTILHWPLEADLTLFEGVKVENEMKRRHPIVSFFPSIKWDGTASFGCTMQYYCAIELQSRIVDKMLLLSSHIEYLTFAYVLLLSSNSIHHPFEFFMKNVGME